MGSPNFGGNSKGIDVPMYAVAYDIYDELEDGVLEYWLDENGLDEHTVENECGINPMNVSSTEIDDLKAWAYDNGYTDPMEYAEMEHEANMEADLTNGEEALDKINNALDTNLLYMEIKNGYWNGYCVMTESPYWDSSIYDINYEWIADDYDVSVEEARKMFAEQIDIVKRMQKSEFGGIGWRPHSGGYTGSFYEE